MTSAYARTLFAGEGNELGVSPSGEGVCYIFLGGIVQPAFSLAENHARNDVAIVIVNLFTLGTFFQVFDTVSEEQRDKDQERAREKSQRNLRNLSEEKP